MQKKIILGIIILLLATGVGYYIYRIYRDLQPQTVHDSVMHKEIPNLDRPVIPPQDFPEEAKKIMEEKIKNLSEELKKSPEYFEGWLQMAIYRKTINDYEGAGEIWEYLTLINPKNITAFNNLGNLYGYYLKDYKKAEENFLQAIKNGPDQIYIYRNVYDFYREVIKDDVKARAILEQGIKANPAASQDLKNLLDNLK